MSEQNRQSGRTRREALGMAAKGAFALMVGKAIVDSPDAQARKYPDMAIEPKITRVFHHRAEGRPSPEAGFKAEVNGFIEKQAGIFNVDFNRLPTDEALKAKARVTSSHPTTEGMYGTMVSQNETTVEGFGGNYTYTFAVGSPEVLVAGSKSSGEFSQLFMQATYTDGNNGQVTSILNFEKNPKTHDWGVSVQRTYQGMEGTADQSLMVDFHPGHNPNATLLAPDMAQALAQFGRRMYDDAAAGRAPQDYLRGVFGS